MDDYIRREDAIRLAEEGQVQGFPWQFQMLVKLPSADVVPVVHTYWEGEETDCSIKCHKCGKAFRDYIITQDYADLSEYPNFCPNCGAKMDGERKE